MKTILVVEDNKELRINLDDILTSEGYNVIFAVDGADGYETALQYQPDLIISDIQMPKMNGLDLLEMLQLNSKTESIPVILFSAHSDPSYIRKGMSIGADDYITKPFKIDDLLDTISARLKKKDKQASKVDMFKNIVIKKVAHELRTPLISILSYPQLLQDNIDELSLDEIKTIAASMKKSGNDMYKNVERILIYSDLLYLAEDKNNNPVITEAEYEIEECALKRDILHELYNNLASVECIIHLEERRINISKEHFSYALKELLNISLTKSHYSGIINISGEAEKNKYYTNFVFNGQLEDNILKDEEEIISPNENIIGSGLGLGLLIVKKIADLYNGNIDLINNANGSARITAGFRLK